MRFRPNPTFPIWLCLPLCMTLATGGRQAAGQTTAKPRFAEIPVIELPAGREAAPEIVKPGAKTIWVAGKEPGQGLDKLVWVKFGPFEAAAGVAYLFDPTGVWGRDDSVSAHKPGPVEASIKFRNLSGKSAALFWIEGKGPAAGARKWKWKEALPPRFLDIDVTLKGRTVWNKRDSEMPGLNEIDIPKDLSINESLDGIEPQMMGNAFYWEAAKEEGDFKSWLRISGLLSDDGLAITELDVAFEANEKTVRTVSTQNESTAYSFTADVIPLIEDEGDGELVYEVLNTSKKVPPPAGFGLFGVRYEYKYEKTTMEKTYILSKSGLEMQPGFISLRLTFKTEK
jgi:hypothetical protein